jgi:hypothetical protein
MDLLDIRMHDGSRHFIALPESQPWGRLRDHLLCLDGVRLMRYLTDDVTEVWIEFAFREHEFAVNNQFGEYWFFVVDPLCANDILAAIVTHCQLLLE